MGLTAERLREVVSYDPENGAFTWRKKTCRKVVPGAPAGHLGTHYWTIGIDGKRYRAHRLAWLYAYGEFPSETIDHANGDYLDNRIANLRAASRRQNMANKRMHKNNACGVKGVYWCIQRHKWRASVRYQGRNKHVGFFESKEAAGEAYFAKAKEIFGEFATQRDK